MPANTNSITLTLSEMFIWSETIQTINMHGADDIISNNALSCPVCCRCLRAVSDDTSQVSYPVLPNRETGPFFGLIMPWYYHHYSVDVISKPYCIRPQTGQHNAQTLVRERAKKTHGELARAKCGITKEDGSAFKNFSLTYEISISFRSFLIRAKPRE